MDTGEKTSYGVFGGKTVDAGTVFESRWSVNGRTGTEYDRRLCNNHRTRVGKSANARNAARVSGERGRNGNGDGNGNGNGNGESARGHLS